MLVKKQRNFLIFFLFCFIFLFGFMALSHADVVINILAVNSTDKAVEKEIKHTLPGEVKAEDVTDSQGLAIDYNITDAGYFLYGKVALAPKETKTLRVKVRDVWQITPEVIGDIKNEIEQGFLEMGAERSEENGKLLKEKLIQQLDQILQEQANVVGNVDTRIDTYRNYLQTVESIRRKAHLIDFWRMDAQDSGSSKMMRMKVEALNKADKSRMVKERYYLPKEVLPEYIVDRKGYEIRYDQTKGQPFLFKESEFLPQEKRTIDFSIKDVWFISQKEIDYVRERALYTQEFLKASKYANTGNELFQNIINQLDLIEALQKTPQPDIQQHIAAFRLNEERFEKVKKDLDALEKLLLRFRAELEKSKIKNVMQKMQSMQSLARVSQAIFDKKPTVNAAWKIIGSVMIFLGLFTIIHFATWLFRSSKEKKQEDLHKKESEQSNG